MASPGLDQEAIFAAVEEFKADPKAGAGAVDKILSLTGLTEEDIPRIVNIVTKRSSKGATRVLVAEAEEILAFAGESIPESQKTEKIQGAENVPLSSQTVQHIGSSPEGQRDFQDIAAIPEPKGKSIDFFEEPSLELPDLPEQELPNAALGNQFATNTVFESVQEGTTLPGDVAQVHQGLQRTISQEPNRYLANNVVRASDEAREELGFHIEGFGSNLTKLVKEDLTEVAQRIQLEALSPIAPFIVEARKQAPGGTQDLIYRVAFKHALAYEMGQMDQAQGGFEEAYNTVKWFLLPTSLFDTPGTIFGPQGAKEFQLLSGLDQLDMLPWVIDEAMKVAGGNVEKATQYLGRLLSTKGAEDALFDNILEGLGISLIAGDAVRLARVGFAGGKMLASATVAKTLSQSFSPESKEAAALFISGAFKDPKFRDALAKSVNELVGDASPFNFGKVDPKAIDGIANEVMEALTGKTFDDYDAFLTLLNDEVGKALKLSSPIKTDLDSSILAYNRAFNEARALLQAELARTPTPIKMEIEMMVGKDGKLGWAIKTTDPFDIAESLPLTSSSVVDFTGGIPKTFSPNQTFTRLQAIEFKQSFISKIDNVLDTLKTIGKLSNKEFLAQAEKSRDVSSLKESDLIKKLEKGGADVFPDTLFENLDSLLKRLPFSERFVKSFSFKFNIEKIDNPLLLRREIASLQKRIDGVKQNLLEDTASLRKTKDTKFTTHGDPFPEHSGGAKPSIGGDGGGKWSTFVEWKPNLSEVTGLMELPEVGVIGRILKSPSGSLSGQEANVVVETAQRLLGGQGKLRATYNSALKAADDPIKGRGFWRSRRNRDEALEIGDEEQRIFGPHEIVDRPYTSKSGRTIQLTQKEYDSYLRYRVIADHAFFLSEQNLAADLNFQGFRRIGSMMNEGTVVVAKPLNSIDAQILLKKISAEELLKKGKKEKVSKVYNEATDKFEEIDDIVRKIDDIYEQQVLVDFTGYKQLNLGKRGKADYALVFRSQLGEVPQRGLKPYRRGWMPKKNLGGEYAVLKMGKGLVNGNLVGAAERELIELTSLKKGADDLLGDLESKLEQLQRLEGAAQGGFIDNLAQAEADIIALRKDLGLKKGENSFDITFTVKDDYEDIRGIGKFTELSKEGAHRGARKTDGIMLDGQRAKRTPVGLALMQHMDMLSKQVPTLEWKLYAEDQWVKMVNNNADIGTVVKGIDDSVGTLSGPAKAVRSAEFMRDYVKSITLTRSAGENAWQNMMRSIAVATESNWLPNNFVAKSSYWLSHTDPVGAAKGMAFNAYLGFANISQMWVQAQIASIAMSIHPIYGVKASTRGLPILYSIFTRNKNAIDDMFKAANKVGIKGSLREDYDLIQASGLMDTLSMIGEHQAAKTGHSYGREALRRANAVGLLPYNVGESYGRIISFLVAKDELLASKLIRKTAKGFSQDDLDLIVTRTNQYMLQMNQVNTAVWQHGIYGLPTQFMQVQTKMIESWLPKRLGGKTDFTGTEKVKLFLGQMMQYGAAGVPFGDWAVNFAAERAGVLPKDVDENMVNYIRGGIMGVLTNGEVSAASRGAIAAGIQQTIDQIFLGNKQLWKVAAGAFGGLLTTEAKALRTLFDVATSGEPTATDVAVGMAGMLDVVSTWKNARHALQFMMRKQEYLKSSGVPIPFEFSTLEMVAKTMGFQPEIIKTMNLVVENDRQRKERLDSESNRLIHLYNVWSTSRDTPEASDLVMSEIKLWMSNREDDPEFYDLMKITHNKMIGGIGTEGEIWKAAMEQSVNEFTASFEAAAVLNRLEE